MTRKFTIIVFALVFLIGGMYSPVLAKHKKKAKKAPVYYLSLGTSLAAGVQADPLTGESYISDVSYPSELADILKQDIKKLRHVNLGCPGENAATFMDGGLCDYPKGSQFDQAVQFLHAHGKFTGLITIDLGANDVLQCVNGTEFDLECIGLALNQLSSDLAYIIETLRAEAPGVPIVGMNYYNPLLMYWFQDPTIAALTAALQTQINLSLESVYSAYGVPVANVAGAFMADDLTTDVTGPDGVPNSIPDSVDLVCAWTWMCSHQNIHANEIGYEIMAQAFYDILPEIPISKPPRKRIRRHGNR